MNGSRLSVAIRCRGATICHSLGFQPKVDFSFTRMSRSDNLCCSQLSCVTRFPLSDPQNVAPRRIIFGIRTLGWKPKAFENSASSTSSLAKAINGYLGTGLDSLTISRKATATGPLNNQRQKCRCIVISDAVSSVAKAVPFIPETASSFTEPLGSFLPRVNKRGCLSANR